MIERTLYKPLLMVSLAVWFGFLAIYVGISMIEGSLPQDLPQRLVTYSFSAALCFLAGVLCFTVLGNAPRFRWVWVSLIALVTLLIHAAFGVAFFLWFPPFAYLENAEFLPLFRGGIIYDSPIVSSVFMSFIAIHFGRELAEQQRLTMEREAAAREAQLATLRHQLSPHFLFNTLNSISALISEGNKANAERTILMLSDFLRFSLESEAGELVPLEEELASMRAYLAIEHVRYEDRLQVSEEIDDAAKSAAVPPFLLQPIVENIVKHAVSKQSRPVNVMVKCSLESGELSVVVEDNGPGLSGLTASTTGTGLRNLRQRLRLLYGRHAKFAVSERAPHGVRVEIALKTRPAKHA
ncbi:sensor histidine kinase [Erythrobacter ani]|uniref:Histidine kinase n=1 Tax=Erythrobacter ani TaxID=2827235 RepID=A0ABS6SKI4_9SPHN|nr:histidine kinase [Erythrobacter ani]MBV7265149.1 histidine kinase [Erythrobacter ani]